MIAELCRVTQFEERTSALAFCKCAKQIGNFIGPAFQLLFSYCHFSVFGYFEINPLNAAGAFMGIVWLAFLFLAMAAYHNLTAELEKMQNIVEKSTAAQAKRQEIRVDSVIESIHDSECKRKNGSFDVPTSSAYVEGNQNQRHFHIKEYLM